MVEFGFVLLGIGFSVAVAQLFVVGRADVPACDVTVTEYRLLALGNRARMCADSR